MDKSTHRAISTSTDAQEQINSTTETADGRSDEYSAAKHSRFPSQESVQEEPSSIGNSHSGGNSSQNMEESGSSHDTNDGGNSSASEQRVHSSDMQTQTQARIRYRRVLAENKRLKRRQLCSLCKEREVNITVLPCGHFVFCDQCANSISHCAICKTEILADVKTFLS